MTPDLGKMAIFSYFRSFKKKGQKVAKSRDFPLDPGEMAILRI